MTTFDLPLEYTFLQARLIRRRAWVDDALLALAEAANDAPVPHTSPPIMIMQAAIEENSTCEAENERVFRSVEYLAEAMALAVTVSRWHHTNEVAPKMFGAAVRFPPPEGGGAEVYFLDEQLPYIVNPRKLHMRAGDIKVISPFTLAEYSVCDLEEECPEIHMNACAQSEQERLRAMPNPYDVAREHGHDLAAFLAEYESWVCNALPPPE